MTSCCPLPRMPWNGATGAIARCKRVFIGCGHKSRSGPAWPWICGVKPTPKAGNKPWHHFILHGLDKRGSSATVSFDGYIAQYLGDGVLVYFGYPVAHEDDAQRAVRTGLGILDAIDPLNTWLALLPEDRVAVRLGVHTGLVV